MSSQEPPKTSSHYWWTVSLKLGLHWTCTISTKLNINSVTLLKTMLKYFLPFSCILSPFSIHVISHTVSTSMLYQPLFLSYEYVNMNKLRHGLSDVPEDPEEMRDRLKSLIFYEEGLSRVSGAQGTTKIENFLGIM